MALSQWFPRSRRGDGAYSTQDFTIPVGVDRVRIKLDVLPNDFSTPDLSVTANIETSDDNGQTWIHQMGVNWIGGPELLGRSGEPIGWVAEVSDISRFSGLLVRVNFSTIGTFRWGLLGEIY